ncbi:MAG: FAD-dependent oxidoreductase, partial [Myxococcota bacterium]
MNDYDVAIVGSGLAGSSAAILFARHGLKVALLERSTDPQAYKALCSHYIRPSAFPTMRRLGIEAPIESAGGVRTLLRDHTPGGWIDDAPDGPFAYNIRREKLDPLLRQRAAETPGVDLRLGNRAVGVIEADGATEGDRRIVGVRIEDREQQVS